MYHGAGADWQDAQVPPIRPAALVLAGLLALGACSGNGPTISTGGPSGTPTGTATATPTASPTAGSTPSAVVTVPPATSPATPSRGVLSAWKGCGSGFECATLTVAMDDSKPALGTVGLALTRHRATGHNRVGSLLVDPGGPGASAVDFAKDAYTILPATVRQHFDIVAFDPRGVGHTAPVRCGTTSELDAFFAIDPDPDDAKELAALDNGNRKLAAGCERRSARILPYVSTSVAAQDMDRVRQAVGDAKLTYLGYSYGTSLGAAYLEQFPTRVRAMVLDGAVDPALTWDQLLAGQAGGFDGALRSFLADCEKTRCAFRTAVSGDLGQAYDRLAASVDRSPLPTGGRTSLGPSEFTYGVADGLYSKNLWPAIARGLAEVAHGQGQTLLALNDDFFRRTSAGYENLFEALNAVTCIDQPWPRSVGPYQALADRVARTAPRFGRVIALSLACISWPVRPVSTPHRITAPGMPPVLVIGTSRDPATPFAWARSLAGQLSRGILVTHDGDGHTAYRSSSPACLQDPVNAYLVSLRVPAPFTC